MLDDPYYKSLPPLIARKQVEHLLNIGKATLYRYMEDGRVQRPIKMGGTNRWKKSYIAELAEKGIPPRSG